MKDCHANMIRLNAYSMRHVSRRKKGERSANNHGHWKDFDSFVFPEFMVRNKDNNREVNNF